MPPDRPSAGSVTVAAPSGSVTLMFTDIEGSTQLLEQLRDRYAIVLEQHRDLVRESFSRWDGYEVDTQGDSFFVAFASAASAVACGTVPTCASVPDGEASPSE